MNTHQPVRRLNLEIPEQGLADDFHGRIVQKYAHVRKEDFADAAHQMNDTVLQIEHVFGRPATVRARPRAQTSE